MDGWMDGVDGLAGWMDGWMYGCINVNLMSMYVYVCISRYLYVCLRIYLGMSAYVACI